MSISLRNRLFGLVLALAIPLVGVASAGVYAAFRSERRATEHLLRDTSRAVALGIDREVGKAAVVLRLLSQSALLSEGNLAGFHERAKKAVDDPDSWIALATPEGNVLLTTAAPFGTRLPPTARTEALRRIASTRAGELSGVFTGAYTGRTLVALEVPVIDADEVRYILSMALSAELFQKLLGELQLPGSWVASITDRNGKLVARSRDHDRFVAKETSEKFRAAIRAAPEGAISTVSLEGVPILTSYSRTPEYGLFAAVNYPLAEFQAAALRSLWWVLALVGMASLGLLFALRLARGIAEPVEGLLQAARTLGAGEPVPPSTRGVREVDEVHSELVRAGKTRREAELAIRDTAIRLRLAMDAGELGEWEYDPAGDVLVASPACKAKFGRQPEEPFTYTDLVESIHPEDREPQREAVSQALARRSAFLVEYRVLWPDGTWHWVQVRGRTVEREGSVGLIGVSQDVTAQRVAEAQQDLLVHELSHRVKNTLAVVQSIARMTFRSSANPEAALEAFSARLHGMARTQDLLTASHWEGAALRDILAGELDPYQDIMRQRIALRGNPVTLGSEATLALSLAVHELATNAAKYGSLSVPNGKLVVRWRTVSIESLPHLLIEWAESGGPPVVAPVRQGFGSRLIQRGLAQDLDGDIKLNFSSTGLICVITFPLHRVTSDAPVKPEPGGLAVEAGLTQGRAHA